MPLDSQCIAIIPCHNEAENVESVIGSVRKYIGNILVVDDASSDATHELAQRMNVQIIRHRQRSGKGAALQNGMKGAIEMGFSYALTIDGDMQHEVSDIPKLLAAADNSPPQMVIGNRMSNAETMPWLRQAANHTMSGLLSFITGHALPDTQCGLRLISMNKAFVHKLTANHFETESDQILVALELGWPISFVPTACNYQSASSRIRIIPDTLRWIRWLSRQVGPIKRIRKRASPLKLQQSNPTTLSSPTKVK